ncbi:MAG: pyridoxamine 5'-phosphate oxidase family protein [Solirubrobacteraceae bacterium]
MACWCEVVRQEPELAAAVLRRFQAHKHKTIATLRRDGSPRISGIECEVVDGELQFGSMWMAMKARDLLRDGRFALHSGTDDPPDWDGDAKIAGTVRPQTAENESQGRHHVFKADITEIVLVSLNESRDKLVVQSWHEGRGRERVER